MKNYYDDQHQFDQFVKDRLNPDSEFYHEIWPNVLRMLGDVNGKLILDFGCNLGANVHELSRRGGNVLGVDVSERAIGYANENFKLPNNEFKLLKLADDNLKAINGKFDAVISTMVFQYLKDIDPALQNIHRLLDDNGQLIFATPHPIISAPLEKVREIPYPIDNYHNQGKRTRQAFGNDNINYHRTFAELANALVRNKFSIREVVEPHGYKLANFHRPKSIIIKAEKECSMPTIQN